MPIKEIEICPLCLQEQTLKPIWDIEYDTKYLCNYCGYLGALARTKIEIVPTLIMPYFWQFGKIPKLNECRVYPTLLAGGARIEASIDTPVTKGTLKRASNRIVNKNSIEIKIVRRF